MVREYVDAADIGKRGSCHLFRHTMATLMLENGADIRFIQAMLGHAKLETTEIYTQVSIRKLKEIHEATHPAKLKRSDADKEADKPSDGESSADKTSSDSNKPSDDGTPTDETPSSEDDQDDDPSASTVVKK